MSQYITNKSEILKESGAIFASDIKTDNIKLDNYQSAKVIIESGEGDAVETTVSVCITKDEEEIVVKEKTITIGANIVSGIDVVANELAHYDATEFYVKVAKVADSVITGTIYAILAEPRYAIED